MIRFVGYSWFCLCALLCATLTCSQLSSCPKSRRVLDIPSVPACQQFVKLLENPQYCSLDQSQNCCIVLAAAVASHCHCWQGLPQSSLGLLKLLHRHCGNELVGKASQNLDIKVFIGVLTGAAHAEQRQAGKESIIAVTAAATTYSISGGCCSAGNLGQRSTGAPHCLLFCNP